MLVELVSSLLFLERRKPIFLVGTGVFLRAESCAGLLPYSSTSSLQGRGRGARGAAGGWTFSALEYRAYSSSSRHTNTCSVISLPCTTVSIDCVSVYDRYYVSYELFSVYPQLICSENADCCFANITNIIILRCSVLCSCAAPVDIFYFFLILLWSSSYC